MKALFARVRAAGRAPRPSSGHGLLFGVAFIAEELSFDLCDTPFELRYEIDDVGVAR